MCVYIYLHICTPSLQVWVYIVTYMHTEFTCVCVYIYIYAHGNYMCVRKTLWGCSDWVE